MLMRIASSMVNLSEHEFIRNYFDGTIRGLTSPQADARNFAVKVLSISMFTARPPEVPVTFVWLVPLKCS